MKYEVWEHTNGWHVREWTTDHIIRENVWRYVKHFENKQDALQYRDELQAKFDSGEAVPTVTHPHIRGNDVSSGANRTVSTEQPTSSSRI